MNNLIIEYSGSKIRILQANAERVIFIDQLEFIDSGFFYLEPKINNKKVSEFTELLISHLKKRNIIADSLTLVLDSKLAYINCIPIDFSDEAENINTSLIWELSSYYPDTYKGFKINYQKINPGNEELAFLGNALVIAYHKNIAEVTRRISEVSSLKINSVNFDVFTAGKYVNKHIKNNFITAGIKKERVDVTFYLNGSISYFMPLNVKDNNFDTVIKELLKLKSHPGFEEISDVYVYGEDSVQVFKNSMDGFKSGLNTVITDPFAVYKPDPLLLENRHDKLMPYSFTPLFGLL